MPRRRSAADQGGPVRRRTRTGCLTCRARKVKCDEGRPRCQKCVSRNLVCERNLQLKWESEFAARGLAFGREGAWTKDGRSSSQTTPAAQHHGMFLSTPDILPCHFVNLFNADFEPVPSERKEYLAESSEPTSKAGVVARTRGNLFTPRFSLLPPVSPFPTLQGLDTNLLEYYLERLCPLTAPSNSITSPFASLVVPLIASGGQDYILTSVMALAARHRSISDARWSRAATSLKGKVLASMRHRLESSDVGMEVFLDSQIPIAMMFLCLDEILDNCDHRWVIHMRAGQDFIRHRRRYLQSHHPSRQYAESDQLFRFAERFFAYQDVISRTACGNAPIFGLEYWENSDDESNYDIWTGYSAKLTTIVFRITDLARMREKDGISTEDFEKEAKCLDDELASFGSHNWLMTTDETLKRSELLKEASVHLYYQCLLKDAGPSTPQVAVLVKQILQEISDLVALGCVAGLMFPLFTAAVELDPLDEEESFENLTTGKYVSGRRLVLDILDALSGVALANIERNAAVIRKVWRMRDLHSLQDDHVDGTDQEPNYRNDWAKFVNPYSLNISLA